MKHKLVMASLLVALFISSLAHSSKFPSEFLKGLEFFEQEKYLEAYEIFLQISKDGDYYAQYALATMYEKGLGIDPNDEEALRWYRAAAEQDYLFAQIALAEIYDGKDDAEAARWYRAAAEKGHAIAQINLAIMYKEGRGIPQNYAEAARLNRAAAEKGFPSAQHNLALMYRDGKGVTQNYAEAARWFRAAAEQGNTSAQGSLGAAYATGRGVIENYVEAHKWLNIAASQGHQLAVELRNELAKIMTPAQIQEAQRLAQEWVNSR